MPDETDAVAYVLAPHPNLALVLCARAAGAFGPHRVPMFIEMQVYVDYWFDARRGVVASQIGGE